MEVYWIDEFEPSQIARRLKMSDRYTQDALEIRPPLLASIWNFSLTPWRSFLI